MPGKGLVAGSVDYTEKIERDCLEVKLGDQIQDEVTVLFSDIRAYTTLSESMTPRQNFNFLNSYLSRVGPKIKENNGFVNQFLGDGIMALFQHHSSDAVKASVQMQKKVAEYNIERQSKGRKPIRVGIGLHTGPLMMGIIGDIMYHVIDPRIDFEARD